MPRLTPLDPAEVAPEVRDALELATQQMGFAANDALTMARNPALTQSFGALVGSLYQPGTVSLRLKRLVGFMASAAAGCDYCKAHTAHSALATDISADELNLIWTYETAQEFSAAERSALRIAHHGALTPNAVTDTMYAEFAEHFTPSEQIELIGIVALFGFLNRWNSTLQTEVEAEPAASANVLHD